MDKKKLAIVVPCYNEEESLSVNIDVFKHTLFALMKKALLKMTVLSVLLMTEAKIKHGS